MRHIYLICLLLSSKVFAQNNTGSRIASMANAGVALQDVWSLMENQAGIANLENPIISIGYEQRFLDKELNTQSIVFAIPVKQNVFGLSFQKYGFSAFSEQKVGFAYAKRFGNTLFAALNFNYHQLTIQNYGSAKAFSAEAGIQYLANEKFMIGAHVANPNKSTYDEEAGTDIPVSLQVGASYKFSDKVLLASSLVKTLNSTMDVKLGLEYHLIKWLALRGGVSANSFKQYVGFGLNYQHFKIDLATSSHLALGYSPQLALSYEF